MTGRVVAGRIAARWSSAPVLLFAALLAGCAGMPARTEQQAGNAWREHAAWVRAQPDWRLTGRFALNVAGRGWTASLHWRETGGRYRIDVFDPLGRTVALLDGNARQVTLRTDNRPARRARSAAALMQSELGWSLPVAGLRYWVRGVPAPGTRPGRMRFDGSGRLAQLSQNGWDITYEAYNVALGPQALPVRMRLVHGKVHLTLLVDRWGATG